MISEDAWLKLQRKALNAVSNAKKKGIIPPITKETKCVTCGKQAAGYRHKDYRNLLDVEPLCKTCCALKGSSLPLYKKIQSPHMPIGHCDVYESPYYCYTSEPEDYDDHIYYLSWDDQEIITVHNELDRLRKRARQIKNNITGN